MHEHLLQVLFGIGLLIGAGADLLFCPVHGLFRPDNIAVFWSLIQSGPAHLLYLYRRLRSL